MLILTTALECEAKPIIRRLKLRKSRTRSGLEIYISDDAVLAVSGVGKLRAAAVLSALLENVPTPTDIFAINLGICGARSDFSLAETLIANKIVDIAGCRSFYPDMIVKHPFKECALFTYDAPQTAPPPSLPENGAVDMEASGFCEAASMYLNSSRFAVIKTVSDFMKGEIISRSTVESLIEKSADQITLYLVALQERFLNSNKELSAWRKEIHGKLSSNLRLTFYQRNYLENLLVGLDTPSKEVIESLTAYTNHKTENKLQQKEAFEEIRKLLIA